MTVVPELRRRPDDSCTDGPVRPDIPFTNRGETVNTSFRSRKRLIAMSAAAALTLVACGGDEASNVTTGDIQITESWARTSPMMATMGAAYMTIMSTNGDRLLAASVDSSVAASAEVHEVVPADDSDMSMPMDHSGMDDMGSDDSMPMGDTGAMVMREVEAIEIPAGEMIMLMPGGYHVMLIDLTTPLEIGRTFDVVLTFETAGDLTVPVEVRDDAP